MRRTLIPVIAKCYYDIFQLNIPNWLAYKQTNFNNLHIFLVSAGLGFKTKNQKGQESMESIELDWLSWRNSFNFTR